MKKLKLFLFLFVPVMGFAQTETLLGGDLSFGGFGGPNVELGFVDGEAEFYSGGSGAMIINGQFLVGGFGQRMVSDHIIDPFEGSAIRPAVLTNRVTEINQGGLWLGYIFKPTKLVHFHSGLQMGAGEVDFYDEFIDSWQFDDDGFFALRPYVGAEMNITSFFKINLSAGYQFINGLSNPYLSDGELSNPFLNLGFKFGYFAEN